MALWARLYIAMVAVILVAAVATGLVALDSSEHTTIDQAVARFSGHAELLAAQLNSPVQFAEEDIRALSRASSVLAIAQHGTKNLYVPGTVLNHWRQHLRDRFVSELGAKPLYLQMRLLDRSGQELVRVDRSGSDHSIRVVSESALQMKRQRPYFAETIRQPPEKIYVSHVELNVEHGVVQKQNVPVIRIGIPVYADSAKLFGALIINLDMRPLLAALQHNALLGSKVFLVNRHGDYLSAPDAGQTFGFDLGAPKRIQTDYPALANIAASTTKVSELVTLPHGKYAVVSNPFHIGGGPLVTVVSMIPMMALMNVVGPIKRSIIIGGAIASLAALLIALVLSYSLSRPIVELTEHVKRWPMASPGPLPIKRPDEVGALARALDQYARKERFAEAMIVSSSDAILTKTLDGTITSWNPAAEELYGHSAAEAIGQNIMLIIPEDRQSEHQQNMAALGAGERVQDIQTTRRAKDGRAVDVSLTLSPVRMPDGDLIGASSIAHDITLRLEHERRLRDQQAELAHAFRLNVAGEMAAALAHELNQPLTAVANYVTAAKRRILGGGEGVASQAVDYIDRANEQVIRASQIIRHLRAFVEKRQLQYAEEDLPEIVSEAVDLAVVGATGLKVGLQFGRDVPRVTIARVQIQQVVVNLVRNAIEAMAGSTSRELVVKIDVDGQRVVVSVQDSGHGIDGSVSDVLFKPFVTSKARGMGIGLSISRSIVEAHGGRLWAENRAGGGAIFAFDIPLPGVTGNTDDA